MKRAAFTILLLITITTLYAQDKKIRMYFNSGLYCKVIKRYEKLSSKKRSVHDLYYRAAAYFKMHESGSNNCDISNPYAKAVTALARAIKHKDAASLPELISLKKDILNAGITLCNNAFSENKPAKVLKWTTLINESFEEPWFLMAEAFATYLSQGPLARFAAEKALLLCKKNDETAQAHFISITQNMLLHLDSVKHKDFEPLMEAVLSALSDDGQIASTFYAICRRNITRSVNKNDYQQVFNTIGIIFSHYPDNEAWIKDITGIVINLSDSLTNVYKQDSSRIDALFETCNLLSKARHILPEKARAGLSQALFHQVSPADKKISYDYETRHSNTFYELIFKDAAGHKYTIIIESLVPQQVMLHIPGFIWQGGTGRKKATKPDAVVKEETFNQKLLDSLCMVYCNEFRAENKLPPLLWHPDIYRASRHHATVMACVGAIFHGEEMHDIYGPADSVAMYNKFTSAYTFNTAGENVLYNYAPGNGITYSRLAHYIIDQWIDSPGHRANMLKSSYVYGTTSACIANYRGQPAIFTHAQTACNYYPELCKMFEIFPGMGLSINTPKPICYASQNFGGSNE